MAEKLTYEERLGVHDLLFDAAADSSADFTTAIISNSTRELMANVLVSGASATVASTTKLVRVNYAGAVTLTLPAVADMQVGQRLYIKDESGAASVNNITIETAGSETLNGSTNGRMENDYEQWCLYTNGTDWFTL